MLADLTIENFKAFGVAQRLPLRPITLLFGANSSGKSSVIQSLLLLKQTLEEAENPQTTLLPKGKLVNLGSHKEMVFQHDTSRSLTLTLGFAMRENARRRSRFAGREFAEALSASRCSFSFCTDQRATVELSSFRLLMPNSSECILECRPGDAPASKAFRELYMFGPFHAADPLSSNYVKCTHVSTNPELYSLAWREFSETLPRIKKELDRQLATMQRQMDAMAIEPASELLPGTANQSIAPQSPKTRAERRTRESREELDHELKDLKALHERLREYTIEKYIADAVAFHEKVLLTLMNYLPVGMGIARPKGEDQLFLLRHRFGRFPWMGPGEEAPLLMACLMRCSELREILERTLYLGPLREYPERHYIFSGNLVKEVGKSGKGMPDLLFKDRPLVRRVNEWLSRFGVDYSIDVRTVKDPDVEDVFTLRLTDKRTGVTVSPLDVGFGISQILPIIVQSLLAQGRVICVEQPEIHLHPRLQAEFGSLLAEAIKGKNANQFIIETHSEHLILRLQRLVRKGTLSPRDVAVVHVRKTESGSVATELRLDEQGEFIDRWPEGFFEEDFVERFAD